MKKLKIFPKMFIQIFSILGIIIILVHSLVFFIFPKTYLETRKEKIYNIANEISSNMNGKEIKYIEQTLELYSKSSEIKAFIKEENNKNEIQIKDNINVNLESDSNSLIIEEREIKLNDGKKINLQFVSTADMQKDAKDLSIKFLPYSLLISILFSAVISLIYAKLIKNNLQEIKIVTDKMMKLDKKTRLKVSSNDEVGELKQQINDLYSTLLRTIDDLEFKNKEIIKLEKLKYDFFKGASHELKTPLASLKIILENMKYNIGKYKERDIYINECIEIVDSLTKNISQILSVHSIENLNNDEEKDPNLWFLNKNVISKGKTFGIPNRNIFEAVFFTSLTEYCIVSINFTKVAFVSCTVIICPIVFGLFLRGLKNRSVLQILFSSIKFHFNRRELHLRSPEYVKKENQYANEETINESFFESIWRHIQKWLRSFIEKYSDSEETDSK